MPKYPQTFKKSPTNTTIPKKKRPIGLAKGDFVVPESFIEPLPLDVLRRFIFSKKQ